VLVCPIADTADKPNRRVPDTIKFDESLHFDIDSKEKLAAKLRKELAGLSKVDRATLREDLVRQFHTSPPSQQLVKRPDCPKCGTKMWLARIEPDGKPDHDVRTFECPECDHSESVTVKFC
jgi:hypothetical protein